MKNSTVLITGGTGFIGTALVKSLRDNGFTNIVATSSKEYNLTEKSQVRALFDDVNPSYVIHLAAKVGGIADIKKYPADYYYENMLMCTYVLDECCRHNVKKLVAIGTNCSYPDRCSVPFQEDDLFQGYPQEANASYGIAKRAFYQQCLACKQQYGQNFIYLIPTNAYGEGDHFDEEAGHVIPSLIKKFSEAVKNDATVTLWGSGKATREFMYITDVCQCITKALMEYNSTQPMNLGTGIETSIKELAETIAGLSGYKKEIVWDTDKPEGYMRKFLDNSRMIEFMGKREFISLSDGLKRTIEWAMKNGKI